MSKIKVVEHRQVNGSADHLQKNCCKILVRVLRWTRFCGCDGDEQVGFSTGYRLRGDIGRVERV